MFVKTSISELKEIKFCKLCNKQESECICRKESKDNKKEEIKKNVYKNS